MNDYLSFTFLVDERRVIS